MELKDLFTYQKESRDIYKRFLETFKFSLTNSSQDYVVFTNSDTNIEVEFFFEKNWIKFSIRYYDEKNDKMCYVYNYFWNKDKQTEFYFIGGDKNYIDYFIKEYVNGHWFSVSLKKFVSVLCSKKVADVVGTDYFMKLHNKFDNQKIFEDNIVINHIGGKYMYSVSVLGYSVIDELEELGYKQIEDNETLMIFEHKDNLCKIVIKQNNGNYTVNFENRKDEKFLKNDWYLGNSDGVCCTDIFTIMEKPEFKKFADVSQTDIDDIKDRVVIEDDNKVFDLNKRLSFFFNSNDIDKFEKTTTKHKFNLVKLEDDGTIVITNEELNLSIKLFVEDENVWCKDLSSGLQNCIGTISEDKIENFEKTLSLRVFQKESNDNEVRDKLNLPNFENVRIHKGTEQQFIIDDTKEKIKEVCDNMADLLIYKNIKYGNSALEPQNIFYKGDTENSILIRIDDKLGRIINNRQGIRINDVCDIIGYLVLYLVFKNVSKADIEKLKD